MQLCRNCGFRHWPYERCPRGLFKILLAVLLFVFAPIAVAHPGHGETLHAHPELWAVVLLVAILAIRRAPVRS